MRYEAMEMDPAWEIGENTLRQSFYDRSKSGARAALEAMQIDLAREARERQEAEVNRLIDERKSVEAEELAEAQRLEWARVEAELAEAKRLETGPYEPTSPDSANIMREICRVRKIRVSEIKSAGRTDRVVQVRQEIAYWVRQKTKLSLPQIGTLLGNRDHTTILHSIRRYATKHGLPVPERK